MKKFVSFLSACLLAISCIAFNSSSASAEGSGDLAPAATFPLFYAEVRDKWQYYYRDYPFDSLEYIYTYDSSNDRYCLYIIPPDIPIDAGYPQVYDGTYQGNTFLNFGPTFNSYINSDDSVFRHILKFTYQDGSYERIRRKSTFDGVDICPVVLDPDTIISATIPIYDASGDTIYSLHDGAPIEVEFSPGLYTDMTGGTISYPSKGGANGSEVVQHIYNIKCRVSLSDNFVDKLQEASPSLQYTYQFTSFIVPSEYKNSDIQTCAANAVFTSVNVGDFLYNDEDEFLYFDEDRNVAQGDYDPDNELGSWNADIDDTDPNNASANGLTNIYVIPRDSGYVEFDINMQHIDWANLESESYNVITFAHLTCLNEFGYSGHSLYFNSSYSGLTRQSTNTFPLSLSDDADKITLYEYYTAVSNDFSWDDEDIPPYDPFTPRYDEEGNPWNPNTSPLDFNNLANTIATLSDHNNGRSKTPSEFDEYMKNWNLSENFGVTEITDWTDIFSTTSSFFEFLTSGLKILPTWFIAIFSTFFTMLLTLAIIKFILG